MCLRLNKNQHHETSSKTYVFQKTPLLSRARDDSGGRPPLRRGGWSEGGSSVVGKSFTSRARSGLTVPPSLGEQTRGAPHLHGPTPPRPMLKGETLALDIKLPFLSPQKELKMQFFH